MTNMGKNGKNTGDRHNKWTEAAEAGLLFGAHMLAGGLCWLLLVTRRPLECGLAVWAGLVAALVVVGHQLQARGSTHFNPTWPLVRTYPSTSGRPR